MRSIPSAVVLLAALITGGLSASIEIRPIMRGAGSTTGSSGDVDGCGATGTPQPQMILMMTRPPATTGGCDSTGSATSGPTATGTPGPVTSPAPSEGSSQPPATDSCGNVLKDESGLSGATLMRDGVKIGSRRDGSPWFQIIVMPGGGKVSTGNQ